MKMESFSRMWNEIRNCNDVLIIFIFESQAGVWSRVELGMNLGQSINSIFIICKL